MSEIAEEVVPKIDSENFFATTRNPAMAHILKKMGFTKNGNTYKNDLELYTRPHQKK
jgi:hypothetical protein